MKQYILNYTFLYVLVLFFGCKSKEIYTFNNSNNNPVKVEKSTLNKEKNDIQLIDNEHNEVVASINDDFIVSKKRRSEDFTAEKIFKVKSDNIENSESQKITKIQKKVLNKIHKKAQKKIGDNQVVAFLLCWFFGFIGIHRFYLGYPAIGVLQILTLGGCGIWALIDLIRIAIGDLKPNNSDYGTTIDDAF